MNDYPALRHLLGGYFHQDFLDEFAEPLDAARAFATGEPPAAVQAAGHELALLQQDAQFRADPDLVLQGLGCSYNPAADGLTAPQWLGHVQQVLQESHESGRPTPVTSVDADRG